MLNITQKQKKSIETHTLLILRDYIVLFNFNSNQEQIGRSCLKKKFFINVF